METRHIEQHEAPKIKHEVFTIQQLRTRQQKGQLLTKDEKLRIQRDSERRRIQNLNRPKSK